MKIASLIPTVTGAYPKDFTLLVDLVTGNGRASKEDITDFFWKAYQYSQSKHEGQSRESGKPYFGHCYAVAKLLAEWQMDTATIISGILHDSLEDTEATYDELVEMFGLDVADLVDGVTKLADVRFSSRKQEQAENLMKMLLSMARDIRVIIIKFADRYHNMMTIEHLPLRRQHRIAIETRDVYSPLAHRLGMHQVKSQLDDLVLKTLEPDLFKEIRKSLKSTFGYRQKYVREITLPLKEQLQKLGVEYSVSSRLKSYSSIAGKMKKSQKPLNELYDIYAIRVIVQDIPACYTVLGTIHQLFTPVHERFKDFIATPKINGYQSLHTTVVGSSGRMVEIQIRTQEMDRTAEIGVAAHWRYKENEKSDGDLDRHINWLRDLVAILQDESSNPAEFMNLLQIDLFQDEVFCFTPAGDLIQLPVNSTPIDFAYAVHTEVGNHCLSAKVNGKIVPLNTSLQSGQTIEIITSDSQSPSYGWLKVVRTSKARTSIRRWIHKVEREESIKLGREILDKTLRRLKLTHLIKEIKKAPPATGYGDEESIMAAIGAGQITVRDLILKISPETEESGLNEIDEKERFLSAARRTVKGVRVHGIDNIMMNFGKCCNPIPGDDIIGFVTRGRGVTVHRLACKNLPVMSEDLDRILEVEWNVSRKEEFLVRLKVVAEDRKGYLKDLTEAISGLNINITSVDIKVDESGVANCFLVVTVPNLRRLNSVLRRIGEVTGTIYSERAS
ncbi:MAG: RelA/SpoT family protein [Fidelibacterota bacterium]